MQEAVLQKQEEAIIQKENDIKEKVHHRALLQIAILSTTPIPTSNTTPIPRFLYPVNDPLTTRLDATALERDMHLILLPW